jgi:ATP-dependent protease Clp ATPase subunit
VNEKTENIGARRLYTVMEKLLEEVSFDARSGSCKIDAHYVDGKLDMLSQKTWPATYSELQRSLQHQRPSGADLFFSQVKHEKRV